MKTPTTMLLLALVAACAAVGCDGLRTRPSPSDPGTPALTQPVDPAVGVPGAGTLAATVNGEPIRNGQMQQLLLASYGNEALQQLVASAVVAQAAARENVAVTSEDIQAENELTIKEFAPNIDKAKKEALLAQLLKRRNIPRVHWEMTMRRNAILRKIAAKRLKITDAMLTAEFNRLYGLKVQVRHIQCASVADAQKILRMIEQGGDFAELARKFSTNTATAPGGGLIPPFSRDSQAVPTALREAAFALADGKVGQIVMVAKDCHVLRREKTILPKDVTYDEKLKAQLRRQLSAAQIRPMQTRILHDLIQAADVKVLDPVLKKQVRAKVVTTGEDP